MQKSLFSQFSSTTTQSENRKCLGLTLCSALAGRVDSWSVCYSFTIDKMLPNHKHVNFTFSRTALNRVLEWQENQDLFFNLCIRSLPSTVLFQFIFKRSPKMDINKKKICYILKFFFDHDEKAAKPAAKINLVYGPDTVNLPILVKVY